MQFNEPICHYSIKFSFLSHAGVGSKKQCNVHIMHGIALSVSPTNLLLEERGDRDPGKGSSCTMAHHVTCIKQTQIVLQSMLTICCFLLHAVVGGGPGNE